MADTQTPATGNQIAVQQMPDAIGDGPAAELRRRAEDAERHSAILEARAELSAEASDRLAIIIGAFGIVIAVVGIIFGVSTRSVAIAEARESVKDMRQEFADQVERAKAEIKALEDHGAKLRKALDPLELGATPDNPEDRETVKSAAQAASEKPPAQRTPDDLKALIVANQMAGDWQAMEDHAGALIYLHPGNRDAESYGLFYLAYAQSELGRGGEAIATLDRLISRFGDGDAYFPGLIPSALYNKGVQFEMLDRLEEAVSTYDEVIARFGGSAIPLDMEPVAKAIVNKGVVFGRLDRDEEAKSAFEDVIARFDGSDVSAVREQVAKALVNKSIGLTSLNRPEDALLVCDDVIARFGGIDEPALQEQVAKALISRGVSLAMLGRGDEAVAGYQKVVEDLGSSDVPALRTVADSASYNLACAFALQRKPEDAVLALEAWRSRTGTLDCKQVEGDPDFDAIRQDPLFLRFMEDCGCTGGLAEEGGETGT